MKTFGIIYFLLFFPKITGSSFLSKNDTIFFKNSFSKNQILNVEITKIESDSNNKLEYINYLLRSDLLQYKYHIEKNDYMRNKNRLHQ